jgi:hypothetical protein
MKKIFILLLITTTGFSFWCCKKRIKQITTVDKSTQTQHLQRRVAFILNEAEELKRDTLDAWVTPRPRTPSSSGLYVDVLSEKYIEGKK